MTQYIISDTEKNNLLINEVYELTDYFISKKQLISNPHKVEDPLHILSEVLKETRISLYDNQELLEKYPHGVVTENLILLPVDKFEQMRKDFAEIKVYKPSPGEEVKKLTNSLYAWANFLTQCLTKTLELKLDISLTEDESYSLSENTLNTFSVSQNNSINYKKHANLSVLKNADFLHSIADKSLILFHVLELSIASFKKNQMYFKEYLSQKPELLENLPTVEKVVKNFNNSTNLVDINDIKNTLSSFDQSKDSVVHTLSQIHQFVDKLNKLCEGNQEMFIEKASESLFPVLGSANENIFNLSLQYINQNVFPLNKISKDGKLVILSLTLDHFLDKLDQFCNNHQRNIMINVMTDCYLFSSLHLSGDKELEKELSNQINNNSKAKIKM